MVPPPFLPCLLLPGRGQVPRLHGVFSTLFVVVAVVVVVLNPTSAKADTDAHDSYILWSPALLPCLLPVLGPRVGHCRCWTWTWLCPLQDLMADLKSELPETWQGSFWGS